MVRWELIEKALRLFNFGDYILAVVKTLFTDIKSCVLNAGFSSGFFYPTRGIRYAVPHLLFSPWQSSFFPSW